MISQKESESAKSCQVDSCVVYLCVHWCELVFMFIYCFASFDFSAYLSFSFSPTPFCIFIFTWRPNSLGVGLLPLGDNTDKVMQQKKNVTQLYEK